ncbi:MAG TPA: hypothetical protein ENH59_01075 [Bacteroidetes bacterium]|nr:hypothetical protein [Bacteroidota bacterium]
MKKRLKILIIPLLFISSFIAKGQEKLNFKGQLSAYTLLNPSNELSWQNGLRYIPQVNYQYSLSDKHRIGFEASANLYGNAALALFDSSYFSGDIKPYRFWARYSTNQFELRAGLQKINFGSASILRPLMWFDQIDPRDPLKLTDGVWGVLARYYFLNNANIWLWGLYGNENLKGWETFSSDKKIPEFGGRLQSPVPHGEAGFSYHHRIADCSSLSDSFNIIGNVTENRFGFDAKFDMNIGWWIEASWSAYNKEIGMFSNQEIINLGADYTFSLGNGLTVIYEQLIASLDENPFGFENVSTFSLLNLSYPLGLFDKISAIVYFDWANNKAYNFLNWQRVFNKYTLYLMAYINPKDYNIPTPGSDDLLYAGSGIQLIFVFNH